MHSRSLALGFASAAFVGAMLSAPGASAAGNGASDEAWPPGNCPQGKVCVWAHWAFPEPAPVETPSVAVAEEWSGDAPALTYYNHTPRNADLKYYYIWPDGSKSTSTLCVPSNSGNIFYVPVNVTAVTWHNGSC
ncbi:hypothetical protein [Streptomyces sp. NPDC014623]|uniref:hypothetical protein n=1 Tax=Streptomyces sp. NPDC014623 TaxID=3364875 RepID=UPI0036F71EAE